MRRPNHVVLWVAGLALSAQAAAPQRCDLVSQPGPSKCLDLSQLNGSTIRVPANTTRIPSNALDLCGISGSTPPPTDIVYLVDQTASMVPTAILPGLEDTSGYYECNRTVLTPAIKFIDTIQFHGQTVGVVDPTTSVANLRSVCQIAGDPYRVRSSTIQKAIQNQATMAPGSYAAVVQFGPSIWGTPTPMTSLATQAGINSLLNAVPLGALSGTNYEAPLDWARILLYGGHSGTAVTPASLDPNKAVIMISDGRPTQGTWQNALKATDPVTVNNLTWTQDAPTIPPVYGIYLGVDTVQGSVLQTLATTTGGMYYQVPPNMPDSLAIVIQKILGSLIKPAKPDTFTVTNQTNGQSSFATASIANGNSYRMQLDSLVALNPGANTLSLKLSESGVTTTATWSVVVSDTGSPTKSALDTLLAERCGPVSSLVLQPDKSGRTYATDSVDRNVLVTLHATPDVNNTLPLTLSTWISADQEKLSVAVPATASRDSSDTFKSSIPWQTLARTGAIPGDQILRSGPGWDSVFAYYQMPRDPRDTASAALGLRRAVAPTLTMTPSVSGPTGQVLVTVVDSNIASATIFVTVRHRSGDTLPVKLTRVGNGIYQGSFSFAQGQPINLKDTILELAALGTGLDSLTGSYQTLSATTYVQQATFRLRFLDAKGVVHDSLGFDLLQGSQAPVTVQLWLGSAPCQNCAGLVAISPSDTGLRILSTAGAAIGSLRLSGGQATVMVKGMAPVRAGSILFSVDSLASSVTAQPIRVLPQAPASAVITDLNADGRADQVVVRLRSPLSTNDQLVFHWPDTNGVLQTRTLSVWEAVSDSGGLRLTFSLSEPFAFAATSCPVSGCDSLGYVSTTWYGPEMRLPFAIQDGVDPIPTFAHYSFSASGQSYDTLVVGFSEPVAAKGVGPWVSYGRPSVDSLGVAVKPVTQPSRPNNRTAVFLIDTSFHGNEGDSLRISSSTVNGALYDVAGNIPGSTAHWAPISWGLPPPILTLQVPHAIVKSASTDAPVGEEQVSVMVRSSKLDSWKTLEGPVLTQHDQDTRIGGVVVLLNRIPQTLGMYIYDNLGVMVLKKDLSDLANQAAQGNLQPTRRGDYEVWLTWNGLDNSGKPAASGVYFIRIFGWIKEGNRLLLLNELKSTGFYRNLSK